MEDNKAVIYAVKTGDTCHYIGKTIKESAEGNVTKSLISSSYTNQGLIKIFENHNDIVIEPVKLVERKEWYDKKLQEVVDKYKDDHPLVNAQWMLDGKRGPEYWLGKKRDANTIKRLHESKHKKVLQYDLNGNLIKIWDSGKEVAIEVFKDYRIINGGGNSSLYSLLSNANPKRRRKHGSYWFKEEDFDRIPTKISIPIMHFRYKNSKPPPKLPTHQTLYTVVRYDVDGNVICRYDNVQEAAYELKTSVCTIQRFCRGARYNGHYILKYGEKTMQPVNIEYPKYKCKPLKKYKRPSKAKPYQHTSTLITIERLVNGEVVQTYDDVRHAAIMLGIKVSLVRSICYGKKHKKVVPELRYGKKVKRILP